MPALGQDPVGKLGFDAGGMDSLTIRDRILNSKKVPKSTKNSDVFHGNRVELTLYYFVYTTLFPLFYTDRDRKLPAIFFHYFPRTNITLKFIGC